MHPANRLKIIDVKLRKIIGTKLKKTIGAKLKNILAASLGWCCWITLIMASEMPVALGATLPRNIHFQHLLDNKDIALGEVQAFRQDAQGFMWIGGGGGLIRYDGYEFKFILQEVASEKGVVKKAVKMVNDIYEDRDHILWVSTRTGLLRYDPRVEQLTSVQDDASAVLSVSTVNILQTEQIPTGELLVSTTSGLILLDRKSFHYRAIVSDPTKDHWLVGKSILSSFVDAKGIIWLGTSSGLEKLEWPAEIFTLFKPYPEHPELVQPNSVKSVTADAEGKLWLGTSDGVVKFDPVSHRSQRFISDPQDPTSLSGKDASKLFFDSAGALWIASDGGGISVLEKDQQATQGHFIHYTFAAGRAGSLTSNQVRTIYEDRTGDIWVGNYPAGINYFDRSSAAMTSLINDPENANSLSHNSVLSASEDAEGNLWMGTDGGGLNVYDRKENRFVRYKSDAANEKTLSSNSVLSVKVDSEGIVWAGTWGGGVSRFNPKTGELLRMPYDNGNEKNGGVRTSTHYNNSTVWSITEDRDHQLWFGAHVGGGISKYDRKTGIYTHYEPNDKDPQAIVDGIVWTSFEDSQGRFWLGTHMGLDLMDRTTGTFTHFKADAKMPNSLSHRSVISIFEDRQGRLWFGTEAGLNLLNPDGKSFTVFDKSAGFNDDTIRKILQDAQGRLWLSTNNGISVFDTETHKVKNYNRDAGRLMGGFNTGAGLVAHNGDLIFGGVGGVRIIDTKEMKTNSVVPPIAFTDIKIFADSINVGDSDGLLKESLNSIASLTLDYKKSMFEFSFSALNFRDSSKNNYEYKLEGFDNNWLKVGDRRSAKYTNLNAGTYVFRVKASNNDDVWNSVGKSIKIIQLPPPWKTWWAYSIYALLILASVLAFVQSQRRKRQLIEEQNRLLEIKVAERTAQLSAKNKDIQAMLSHMRQGLFTVEVGGKIHPEYSRYLEDIFETKGIAQQNALSLLFATANLGADVMDQIKVAINSMIGEDEMNFDFNAHLLPREYQAEFGGKFKYLNLDWNPIVDQHIVERLMVSVRDVSLLKEMERDARAKKRELDIVSQLLSVSAKKYTAFSASAKRYIEECRAQLQATPERNDLVIALLFRNMHTIKGNCRTFGFDYFGNVVHEVESTYSALKADQDVPWNREHLLADLLHVERILQEYEHVFYAVLGRGTADADRDPSGFWADSSFIRLMRQSIASTHHKFPAVEAAKELLPIEHVLNQVQSQTLAEVLQDIIDSLPSIALQLEKAAPKVSILDAGVRIKSSATELMTDIFAHILRNSLDHGIELPAERIAVGKPSAGTIDIVARVNNKKLYLHVKDDGKGIHTDALFKKGIALQQWSHNASPSYDEIAQLLFVSGVSTKEQVSEISGRGVGMDAVKQFLLDHGGNIALRLLNIPEGDYTAGAGVMLAFELIIELPESSFLVA